MRRNGLIAIGIVLVLFSFVACRPTYIVPVPGPGGQVQQEITPQQVAESLNLDQLSADVEDVINGKKTDIGITTEYFTEEPSASGVDSCQRAKVLASFSTRSTGSNVIYIRVIFDGYQQNNGAIVIESGVMILTARGINDNTKLVLEKYSAKTVETLKVTTTVGSQVSSDDVMITIPVASIEGDVTFEGSGEATTVDSITVSEVAAPPAHSGATITVGTVEVPVDQVTDNDTEGGFNGLFAGGYGTEKSPYIIETAGQFENLGHPDVQEMLLRGENDNLFFRIDRNINLSNHSGYVAEVFSGHLTGINDGITITCSNDMPYLFHYAFENTDFENFTIRFADREKTVIFANAAVRPVEIITVADNYPKFIYDKESLVINYNNVNYEAPNNNNYRVRDNNFGFYVDGTSPLVKVYNGTDFKDTFYFNGTVSNGNDIMYTVNIENCNVSGNFYGGFSASGAAIFVGGQLCGMEVNIKDSHFNGTLEGYNTALVVANQSSCWLDDASTKTTITVDNVTGGTIISYSGKGGVMFSNNNKYSDPGASADYKTIAPANALTVTGSAANEKLDISSNSSVVGVTEYQYKLSLPTLYWYENGSSKYTGETNSNTFTISYSANETAPDVYIAKPITRTEAEALSSIIEEFRELDWAVADISGEGEPYMFVKTSDGTQYLIIDYKDNGLKMYSDNGIPSSISDFTAYLKVLIALGLNEANEVIATSMGETM